MATMYILECCDGSYYVGSTIDLPRRLEEHDLGLGAAYTRQRRPVRLVYAEEFERIVDAFAFEKRVQGWSRVKRQALIDGRRDTLPQLSKSRQIPDPE
ncbi:MAG TPA: GIY-YIG nuclease family protein [Marmoricola sp.]|nr:GIY-YIG nuclease family protein [Marmoricola sp.]